MARSGADGRRTEKWIPREDVPDEFKEGYDKLLKSYPVPNDAAYDYFKRAGIHWKYSTNFPGWLPDHKPSPVNEKIMVSDALFAFDTATGERLWLHEGHNIPSITITLGDGRIYFVQDDLSEEEKESALEDRENMIEDGVYEAHKEGEVGTGQAGFATASWPLMPGRESRSGPKRWT